MSTLVPVLSEVAAQLKRRQWHLASAESCTGGGVASLLTDLAGSSEWFERGWVTYSNQSKMAELGVPLYLLEHHGAVSAEVAAAMASGAARQAGVEVGLSTTGIAGPGGGSAEKPVGLVWFGWSIGGTVTTESQNFEGDRAEVRAQATAYSVARLAALLDVRPEHVANHHGSRAPRGKN